MTTRRAAGLIPGERVRIGRDERERCVDELQEHYTDGRLGDEELAERVGTALTATTRAIFVDTDAADRAAQQLMEISERNPDAQLDGLMERARASSGRARDAAASSKQIVMAAGSEPTDKVLAQAAESARNAAVDTEKTLDAALERLGG